MDARKIAMVLPFVLLGAPLLLGLVGALRPHRPTAAPAAWNWRLTAVSAVLCALAFNLTFIGQELFLVIPKALTPGLKPTLFHNNHDWSGHSPLETLFQGTGALATVLMASGLAVWLAVRAPRSTTARLFLTWMVFHGFLGALPQVLVGAILPGNDVGMAMDFFAMNGVQKVAAAILALAAIGAVCLWLTPKFLAFADGNPSWAILRVVTIPAFLGVILILPSRVPGALDQVLLVPVAVALIGTVWIQGSAWLARSRAAAPGDWTPRLAVPVALAVVQLLIFQVALRPGIRFY